MVAADCLSSLSQPPRWARGDGRRKAEAEGHARLCGRCRPASLDPALVSDGESFRVAKQIFEGLVGLRPGTRTSRRCSRRAGDVRRTARRGRSTLRHGVKFHDGTPFNAAAVCVNFNRWYNFKRPVAGRLGDLLLPVDLLRLQRRTRSRLSPPLYRSCATQGRYTAVVKLNKPSGPFLRALVAAGVLDAEPDRDAELRREQRRVGTARSIPPGRYAFQHPTGTGPFKFVRGRVGQSSCSSKYDATGARKAKHRAADHPADREQRGAPPGAAEGRDQQATTSSHAAGHPDDQERPRLKVSNRPRSTSRT